MVLSVGGGCATSLLDSPATPGATGAGEGTIVGSFLVEPVPQWTDHPEHFWLLLQRVHSLKQYSIPLVANQEEYVVKHLPAGRYWVMSLYVGKPGAMSRGGRQGWDGKVREFVVQEQQITYIGRLRLVAAKEPDHIRALRQSASNDRAKAVASVMKAPGVSYTREVPRMYVKVAIEESLQDAIGMLEGSGWPQADVARIVTSLMATPLPKKK